QAAQPIAMEDLLVKLPEHMSIRSEDLVGGEMEPVSLVFAGSRDDLQSAFERAGWTLADLPTPVRVVREAIAIATNGLDLSGPATDPYLREAGCCSARHSAPPPHANLADGILRAGCLLAFMGRYRQLRRRDRGVASPSPADPSHRSRDRSGTGPHSVGSGHCGREYGGGA